MAKQFKLGFEGGLYFASDGPLDGRPGDTGVTVHYQNATWVEADNITDVDGDYKADKVDTTTRRTAKLGWSSETVTTKSGSTKTTVQWKPSDPFFVALRNAWLKSEPIAIADLDGLKDEEDAQGLVANMSVEFGKKKPVKGVMMVDVTFTIQDYPNWVEVDNAGVMQDALAP